MTTGMGIRRRAGLLAGVLALAACTASSSVSYDTLGQPITWDNFTSPFISMPRQLTGESNGIRRAGEGYFSPDGTHMIFQAEKDPANPFFQIFMMDMTTGDIHGVSNGTGKTTCAFIRPNSNEVEYASSHHDPDAKQKQADEISFRESGGRHHGAWDYDPMMDIFVADRQGANTRQLTTELGYDAEGSYSPDGSKIVFCSTRSMYPVEGLSEEARAKAEEDASYFGEIYLMDADGTNVTRLTDWPGYDGGPFFTPDGSRIVWRHFEPAGDVAEVYTMKLDGSDRRQLTSMGAMSWAPYFHPTGEYAIYTTNLHGFRNFELYLVDAMGKKEPVRVTDSEAFDGLPVFTPDGNHLCWTASRTANHQGQLFMAKWDHAAAMKAIQDAPNRAMETAER